MSFFQTCVKIRKNGQNLFIGESKGLSKSNLIKINSSDKIVNKLVHIPFSNNMDLSFFNFEFIQDDFLSDMVVSINAPESLIEYISVSKNKIGLVENINVSGIHNTNITIKGKVYDSFDCTVSAFLKIAKLETCKPKLSASTSAKIEINEVIANETILKSSTSGKIKVNSVVSDKLVVKSSTSGKIKIHKLESDNINVELSTSGTAKIVVLENGLVKGSVSTSGKLKIPQDTVVNVSKSTGGEIERI